MLGLEVNIEEEGIKEEGKTEAVRFNVAVTTVEKD